MCIKLLLQPRTFTFKRKQKQRTLVSFRSEAVQSETLLQFGGAGLLLLRPVQLTAKQIFRFKLFLKRASRKSDRTRRFTWFRAFPHLPLTRKPDGTRMGKGKGKLECWFTNVAGGVTLIEFKNLRRGRSIYFVKQMTHKLGVETKYINSIKQIYFNLPLGRSRRSQFHIFW
jgi:large subunit ribosomal protein L16